MRMLGLVLIASLAVAVAVAFAGVFGDGETTTDDDLMSLNQ